MQLETRLTEISKTTAKNANLPIYGVLALLSGDGKTLFTVEECVVLRRSIYAILNLLSNSLKRYPNQAALDAHLASNTVQNLFTFLDTIHVTPTVNLLDVLDSFRFSKPLSADSKPWILIQELTYKVDTAIPQLLPAWKSVVAASQKESGTLLFGAYTDPKNATKLFTVEVYEDFEYFTGTHARGDALAEKSRQTGELVSSMRGAELGLVGGFLHRG